MKSFVKWLESEFDPGSDEWMTDFKRRHKFAEQPLNLQNVPVYAMIFKDIMPTIKSSFYVSIEFVRNNSHKRERTNVIIPFGKDQVLKSFDAAKVIAMKIIDDNKNRYTSCYGFRKTKMQGIGFFSDQNDLEFYS